MAWPTTADGQYYLFDGQVLMPVDPSTGAAILQLRPQGGMAVGIPAIEKGDPGKHAQIDPVINVTELEWDDPSPITKSWTTITPPTDTTPGVYRLNDMSRKGRPGDDGDTILNPDDFTDPKAGWVPAVTTDLSGFELVSQKVGDRHLPATINNTGAGNAKSTLAIVSISPGVYDFDYRVEPVGYTIVTQDGGSNVVVDLVARLNGEEDGNIIGMCHGIGGTERLTLLDVPPPGSADAFDRIPAGSGCEVYFRTEQRSGSNSYITSAATTRFKVKVSAAR